jgi:SAM-dependent methyltransferase
LSEETCRHCGFVPPIFEGFPAWAPELAKDGGAYKLEYFAKLAKLEDGNFWFRARNALIVWALKKYRPSVCSFLEIGCGTGFVISALADNFPQTKAFGSEISSEAIKFAATRVEHGKFMQMDARRIPFVNEFDGIGIFDVLEHIEEDEVVLEQIYRALTPDGVVLITVPQHPILWSESDIYWSHVRRYKTSEIHEKVRRGRFEILRSTSFVSLLSPIMFASRYRAKNGRKYDPFCELDLNGMINTLLEWVMGVERGLTKAGINFPFGGSRLIIARKAAK